jgi:CRP-like cAMP-binding protein
MTLSDEVSCLRQIPLFASIPGAKLKLLAFTSDRVAYEADRIIFKEGESGDAAYVLLSGEVDVIVTSPTGPVKINTIGDNAIVGEIAILSDSPRTATIRTTTRTEVLRIHKQHFLRLLAEVPEVATAVMQVLAQRLSQTNRALTEAHAKIRELTSIINETSPQA